MVRTWAPLVVALILTACGGPPPPGPPVVLPEAGAPVPPVVRRPVEAQATPEPPAAASAPAPETAARAPETATPPATEPPVAIPAGAVYACVVDAAGEQRVTAIELAPKIAALCAQNPEMGPCQYEREVCRISGGRVYAADGTEVTKATEAEYDRRVLRIRINSN